MKKRLISLLLVLALLLTLPVTALAANFSDLEGHWAKECIEELSALGYISGYTDGTVKPNKNITACEALSLLSRFYPVNESTMEAIHEDFGDFVAEYIDPSLKWAYDSIEICLAAGILSENELKNLRLTASIEKELLAVLLVRTLQLTDEASAALNGGKTLTFTDTDEITAAYRGHVYVLFEQEIISGTASNRFAPHGAVTRAVVSQMISKGLKYVSSTNTNLVLSDYVNQTTHSGVIVSASDLRLTLRDEDGVSRSYLIPAAAEILSGTQPVTLADTYSGCYATVKLKEGTVTSVTIRNEAGILFRQGALTSISKTGSGYTLYIADSISGNTVHFPANEKTKVVINGANKTIADLKTGMYATTTVTDGTASLVTATSGAVELTGEIATLSYGAPVLFSIAPADGGSVDFSLDLAKLPTIMRGSNQITIERLKVGESATLTIEGGKLTKIVTASNEKTIDGVLNSIVATSAGTTWIITDTNGDNHSLILDPTADGYQGSTSILLSTVQVGDTVSLVVEGKTILTVYLKSTSGNTATKVTGTVLVVESSKKQVTILTTTGKLVYLKLSSTNVLDATTGGNTTLSSLKVNSQVLAYGVYADGSNFNATSLVIESKP